jgi:hypothetical protein
MMPPIRLTRLETVEKFVIFVRFFRPSIERGWHPHPMMPPNRLTRLGTVEKFAFFCKFLQGINKKGAAPQSALKSDFFSS